MLSRAPHPASITSAMIMQTDSELLAAYRAGSHDAFAALVHRHLPLVYSAATRHTRNPALAEDIAQAVFILLAKHPHKVRSPQLLVAWLLRVTRYCAADARKSAIRQQRREREAAAMSTTSSSSSDPVEIADHLDAALSLLTLADRTAVILRCLEERPLADVARELGLSEQAARKRVDRALYRLRQVYAARGVSLAPATFPALLSRQTIALPAHVEQTISRFPAAPHLPPAASAISKAAMQRMALHTLKTIALTAAAILIFLGTAAELLHLSLPASAVPPTTPIAAPPAPTTSAPPSPPAVLIMGDVKIPGSVPLADATTAHDLLQRATPILDPADTPLIRRVQHIGPSHEFFADIPPNTPLHPGDILLILDPITTQPLNARGRNILFSTADHRAEPGLIGIAGAGLKSGAYALDPRETSILQLLPLAQKPGGMHIPSRFALFRQTSAGERTFTGDTLRLFDAQTEFTLQPNDLLLFGEDELPTKDLDPLPVVRAPHDPGLIYITGNTQAAGAFDLKNVPATIKLAVALAGGIRQNTWQSQSATLIRREDHDQESFTTFPLADLLLARQPDHLLQANDILFLPSSENPALASITQPLQPAPHQSDAGSVQLLGLGKPRTLPLLPNISTLKITLITAHLNVAKLPLAQITLDRANPPESHTLSLTDLFTGKSPDCHIQPDDKITLQK